jgi:histone H2B
MAPKKTTGFAKAKGTFAGKKKKALGALKAAPKAARKAAKSAQRRRGKTFSVYVYRVFKRLHPEKSISKKSVLIMNSFINDMLGKIALES